MVAKLHLFLDLDGTLADSFPGIEYSALAALAEVCPGRKAPDLRPFIGPPIREIFRRALAERDDAVLDALDRAFRRSYDGSGWQRTVAYPGVVQTVTSLARDGHHCHILTNKPRLPTERILQHLGLKDSFERVITPDTRQPPYASKVEAALAAKDQAGVPAGHGLVVGDSTDDAAAAAACGFRFAAATYGYGRVEAKAGLPVHFALAGFSELAQIVRS